jgi:hypothetical protein
VPIPPIQLLASDRKSLGKVRLVPSHPAIHAEARKLEDHWYEVTMTLDQNVPLGIMNESIRVENEHPTAGPTDVPVLARIGGDFNPDGRRIDFGLIREGEPRKVTFRMQQYAPQPAKVVRSTVKLAVPAQVEVTQEDKYIDTVVTVGALPAFTSLDGIVELETDHPTEPIVRITVSGGVLAKNPFEQAKTPESYEKFLAIVKDALSRRDRIPLDRFFSDVLGNVRDERASKLLLRALAEGNLPTRMRAVEALAELKTPEVIEQMRLTITDDQESFVRRLAVAAYADAVGRTSVPTLLLALQDDDAWVREDTARQLEKLGDTRAIPALQAALADPNTEAATAIRDALAALQALVKK